jgi:hypothetical protein
VDAYEFFENPPKGSTLARAPVLLNGFLIANRLPAFDTAKPVESAIQLLNKVCEHNSEHTQPSGSWITRKLSVYGSVFV